MKRKNYFIRLAHKSDLESIMEIEKKCFTQDQIGLRNYQYLLKSPTASIYLLVDKVQIIGVLILFFRKKCSFVRLYSFAINPDFQNQGLGSKFIKGIINILKKIKKIKKINEMCLEVRENNTQALQLYIKNNFKVVRKIENYYDDGSPALRLKRAW